MTTCTATYSPEDNKLRLYSSTKLDAETYARLKAAGFKWAPKQELFVAPMWTPGRADILLEMCGEIDDEDTSLVDRAEERADRFDDYSNKRATEANQARERVSSIADGIPFGQPILVGHHSEKHARKHAQQIENGMRKAVQLWDTSTYWTQRAKGALRAAKYKELPAVRARRIKGLEADKRKAERNKAEAEKWLTLWTACGSIADPAEQHAQAVKIANVCWLHLPRKEGDRPDFDQAPSAYGALTNAHPSLYAPRTADEVIVHAVKVYPRTIAHCIRWIEHYNNRISYEYAMLEEQGATDLLAKKPRSAAASLPICNYMVPDGLDIPSRYHRGQVDHFPQLVMTKEEYAKIYADYKGMRVVGNSHRVRTALVKGVHGCVFLSDSKTHEPPAAVEPKPREVTPEDGAAAIFKAEQYGAREVARIEQEEAAASFTAMRESLRTGTAVQTVTVNQLFPTPRVVAERMAKLADIQPGARVLEPSAGTGMLLGAMGGRMFAAGPGLPPYRERGQVHAVEVNRQLAGKLQADFPLTEVHCADFLEFQADDFEPFDVVMMNPPFENGSDIKHIKHALTMLKPGGRLVAICANGPRQQAAFEDIADYWEELPAGTFAETGVRTVLFIINK